MSPKSTVRAAKQRRKPCAACPMIDIDDWNSCFPRQDLEDTLVANIEAGYVHPCHVDEEFACAGCLSFVKQHEPGGLMSKHVVRVAIDIGLFDPQLVEDLPVFSSIEAMLVEHDRRVELTGNF
jgi:hypothetical protein